MTRKKTPTLLEYCKFQSILLFEFLDKNAKFLSKNSIHDYQELVNSLTQNLDDEKDNNTTISSFDKNHVDFIVKTMKLSINLEKLIYKFPKKCLKPLYNFQ